MWKFATLLWSICLLSGVLQAQGDLYDYNHSLRYANYLVKTRQYQLAAEEWERLVYLAPENDSLKLQFVRTLRYKKDYQLGVRKTESWYNDLPTVPRPFAVEYSRMLLLSAAYTKAEYFVDTNQHLTSEDRSFFHLNRLLLGQDWEGAIHHFGSSPGMKALNPKYQSLINDLQQRKYKRPWVAMSLSAVVPGSGKLYTRDWQDALLSMLTIGTFAWQTYNGFRRDGTESVYGWVFGTVGFGFYTGNIYGSYKAARKYNHDLDHHFQQEAHDLFVRSMDSPR